MNLTKKQKKFIKKNLKKLGPAETAARLKLSEEELNNHLKIVPVNPVKESLHNTLFPLVILFSLACGVYLNALGNDFLSDDIAGIVQDKNMGNLLYYLKNNTINFSRYFVYCLVFKIFGLNPVFFRLPNIIFHAGNTILIYLILLFLNNPLVAFITAGLFAVHPILAESIVWISGGLYAQYSFFTLLAFFLYLLAKSKNRPIKIYIFSVLAFIPALLTTEKAVVLAPILFAYELCLGNLIQTWKKLIPYFVLGGSIAALVFFGGPLGQRVSALKSNYYQEGGLYNPLTQIPTAVSHYLWYIFWPDKLTLYHSEMVFSNGQYALMAAVTLLYLGLIIYAFLQKKYRWYAFWLSFPLISLIPMLTPFKVAWIVAERYFYVGSIGIFVIIGMGIKKIGDLAKSQKIALGILVTLLMALAIRTITRNLDWKNQDTLWLAAARTSPSSPQNHNNLGDLYSRQGQFEKAVEEFQMAIKLLPNYGDAYHNLANTYLQMKKIDLAITGYHKALEYNPGLWQSHQNLAAIYAQANRLDLTEEHLKKAIQINPENQILYLNLGYIYNLSGRKEEAVKEWETVLRIDPTNEEAKKFLQSFKN